MDIEAKARNSYFEISSDCLVRTLGIHGLTHDDHLAALLFFGSQKYDLMACDGYARMSSP
jgi:hypothetical protein